MADNYDATSKLSIVESQVTNLQDGTNLVSLQSINDNLFVMGTILVVSTPVEATLKVDTTEFVAGENATIQASIYYGDALASDISKGKVTFKVNGKVLKDANGKVIYAKVVNGTASIEGYEIPLNWTKEDSVITAIYSGSTQCDKLTSEETQLNVTPTTPTFTTNNVTATVGETINLTATITDGDKVINTGKVVFKINGKTVKDSNGKVIYAKVSNNQVSVEYTIPEDMKAKEYNITAILTSSDYKLEDTKTLTVTS